jgi:hypothetical protein
MRIDHSGRDGTTTKKLNGCPTKEKIHVNPDVRGRGNTHAHTIEVSELVAIDGHRESGER